MIRNVIRSEKEYLIDINCILKQNYQVTFNDFQTKHCIFSHFAGILYNLYSINIATGAFYGIFNIGNVFSNIKTPKNDVLQPIVMK